MKKKVKIYESEIKRAVRRGVMENMFEQHEMKDTYSKAKYRQSPREEEIEGVFGQYGEEIPPSVLRYMRKNPKRIIERLYDVYGQQMFDYISQNLSTPEMDVEVADEEIVVDEALLNVGSEKEAVDAEKAGFEGTIQVKKDLEESDWMQHVSDEIEEDGTEGSFREYCLSKGYRSGCSRGCMEEALRSRSTKLHYRAGLAHAFCSAKH